MFPNVEKRKHKQKTKLRQKNKKNKRKKQDASSVWQRQIIWLGRFKDISHKMFWIRISILQLTAVRLLTQYGGTVRQHTWQWINGGARWPRNMHMRSQDGRTRKRQNMANVTLIYVWEKKIWNFCFISSVSSKSVAIFLAVNSVLHSKEKTPPSALCRQMLQLRLDLR